MVQIEVQRVISMPSIPTNKKFKKWTSAALKNKMSQGEITIRIVNEKEMRQLNFSFRKKDKPTNVLSFPFEMPEICKDEISILGDIVICAQVVKEEARQQKKKIEAHWAHMVVHGALHLLGYDHQKDSEAETMESEEIKILRKLGFPNPYEDASL